MSHYDPNIYFLLLGLVVLRRFYFDLDVTILFFHSSIIKATLVLDLELKGRVGEIEKRKPWEVGWVPWNSGQESIPSQVPEELGQHSVTQDSAVSTGAETIWFFCKLKTTVKIN